MNAGSGSSALLDVSQIFGLEALGNAPWERAENPARGFLIATFDLQEKGQVPVNKSLSKFLTATKTVFSLKHHFADFHFTNVKPCGTRCGKTYA
jgi:hypothetical protein